MRVLLVVAALVNRVFINVQANIAAGAYQVNMNIFFTYRKLPSIHSESVPRSRSKASTFSFIFCYGGGGGGQKRLLVKGEMLAITIFSLSNIWFFKCGRHSKIVVFCLFNRVRLVTSGIASYQMAFLSFCSGCFHQNRSLFFKPWQET